MAATSVRVCCRFRPQNSIEVEKGGRPVVQVEDGRTVRLALEGKRSHVFTFDVAWSGEVAQSAVYDDAAKPVIDYLFDGYSSTIFVYGQTSSGKTYTMHGPSITDTDLMGITPRVIRSIFDVIAAADAQCEFLVSCSYVEIYREKIHDLLHQGKPVCRVREDKRKGVYIEGATDVYVSSAQEVIDILEVGQANRALGCTNMNAHSSRSHSVFVITVASKSMTDGVTKSGKLYLIDLAGSEKVGKTGATGGTLKEAQAINQSLSALGNVINALVEGKGHIPYRDSKLTRLLQESLGGNSRTTLIINCSPSSYNYDETVSTLRFGNRAKNVQNHARQNKQRSVEELTVALEKAEAVIARLRRVVLDLGGTADHVASAFDKDGGASPSSAPALDHVDGKSDVVESDATWLDRLESAREEHNALRDQVGELTDRVHAKKSTIAHLRSQLDAAQEALGEGERLRDTVEKENQLLLAKVADLEVSRSQAVYQQEQVRAELHQVTDERTVVDIEVQSLRARVAQLETQLRDTERGGEAGEMGPDATVTSADAPEEGLVAGPADAVVASVRADGASSPQADAIAAAEVATFADGDDGGDDVTTVADVKEQLWRMKRHYEEQTANFNRTKALLLQRLTQRYAQVAHVKDLVAEAEVALKQAVTGDGEAVLRDRCTALEEHLQHVLDIRSKLMAHNQGLRVQLQLAHRELADSKAQTTELQRTMQESKAQYDACVEDHQQQMQQLRLAMVTRVRPHGSALALSGGGRVAVPIRGGSRKE